MANPDEEGSFYRQGEREPAVKVGEELTMGLTPSSEIEVRIAEMERKLGIPRDPERYPRTTIALPDEDVVKASLEVPSAPLPTPLQVIQSFVNSLPPLKLPPLPPFPTSKPNLPIQERTWSPPEEKEEVAIISEEMKPSAGIVPLVYE